MKLRETTILPLAAALAMACAPAEDAGTMDDDGDEGAQSAEEMAAEPSMETAMEGWNVRLDNEGQDVAGFQMVTSESGFTVQTGPAGIAWRPADLAEEGDFTASATFTEMDAPAGHREAFGIFVGGRNLESPDQEYTYFLVRGDGSYLIKRRNGDGTSDLVSWTPSDAVAAIAAEGEQTTNALAVRVRGEEVEFVANGTVVETLPVADVEPWGVAGIRVNHRLDLSVADWSVGQTDAG